MTARRAQLIEAAHDLIVAHGIAGLRTRAVAAAVGIDHSTLHHHFPTKADLIEAVADRALAAFRPAEGPTQTLTEHLRHLAALMTTRPDLFTLMRELDLHATRDTAIAALMGPRDDRWRASLTALLPHPVHADLVIATVKGAGNHPATAPAVLKALLDLLRK
ncbi:hypothetical protein Afil01_35640 [Actinorhabdospora filicis]|uniref:HTH tetR-type domain-containing protein n=1 Tax=Actinorhabdospora filicis TaxID=1785913 RepID=A0A9W6W411_9ACTN|nr:TetR/AcrR family transcriptional regulator [Actinorhabdospora filicis]GLZ78757.1 hypothetical protein Afil01_35640 [Actinorhabdospora filicis]